MRMICNRCGRAMKGTTAADGACACGGLITLVPSIAVRYSAIDGARQTRRFKTLAGARRFAFYCVGENAEIGWFGGYAVSADGVGKVTVSGCSLGELFNRKEGE